MWLRARLVWPAGQEPIADGAVRVERGLIAEVAPWRSVARAASEVTDLGDAILMPGWVNAHCHLDYTQFMGRIAPGGSFTTWIAHMVALKADTGEESRQQSWLDGARQCRAAGMTTVANIETQRGSLSALWPQALLRLRSFLEVIALRADVSAEAAMGDALDWIGRNLPPELCSVGLSPHAPYTTTAQVLRACAAQLEARLPMAMHLAESAEEDEMFRRARGPLYELVASAGRDMSDCGKGSPVLHAARCGLLRQGLIAVHCNYADADDIALLAAGSVPVVHCPRSHDYFGHQAFPLNAMQEAGVNVCLGTDSLATTRGSARERLDLFEEMRHFQVAHPMVDPAEVVRMATLYGARALAMAGQVGELAPGAWADLIVLPFGGPDESAAAAIIAHRGPPSGVMLNGQWLHAPPSSARSHAG